MAPFLRILTLALFVLLGGHLARAQNELTFQKGDIVTILLNDGSVHSRVKVIDVDRDFIIVAGPKGAQMINAKELAPVSQYRMPFAPQPEVQPEPASASPTWPPPANVTPPPAPAGLAPAAQTPSTEQPAPTAAAPGAPTTTSTLPISPAPAASTPPVAANRPVVSAPTTTSTLPNIAFNPLWLLAILPAAMFLALFLVTRSEAAAASVAVAAADAPKTRRLQCRLTSVQILGEGLAWSLLVVLTLGLALPFCLLGVGRRLINATDLTEPPAGK